MRCTPATSTCPMIWPDIHGAKDTSPIIIMLGSFGLVRHHRRTDDKQRGCEGDAIENQSYVTDIGKLFYQPRPEHNGDEVRDRWACGDGSSRSSPHSRGPLRNLPRSKNTKSQFRIRALKAFHVENTR